MDYDSRLTDCQFNSVIVKRLKELRIAFKLTQARLGEHVGLTEQQVKEIETERTPIDIPKLRRFCEFYGVQILAMLPDTEVTKKDEIDLGNISANYKTLSSESREQINRMIMYLIKLEANK